jgi:hypothetical protein
MNFFMFGVEQLSSLKIRNWGFLRTFFRFRISLIQGAVGYVQTLEETQEITSLEQAQVFVSPSRAA